MESTQRAPLELPLRKPMARARRVSLFEREVSVRLSPAAIEVLFDVAAVLSEGQADGARYFGSTMLTIDLSRATPHVSDDCDIATVRRVAELAATDDRVRRCARGVAAAQAARFAGEHLRDPQIDFRVRRTGRQLHLDLDVEGSLSRSADAVSPSRALRVARRTP